MTNERESRLAQMSIHYNRRVDVNGPICIYIRTNYLSGTNKPSEMCNSSS